MKKKLLFILYLVLVVSYLPFYMSAFAWGIGEDIWPKVGIICLGCIAICIFFVRKYSIAIAINLFLLLLTLPMEAEIFEHFLFHVDVVLLLVLIIVQILIGLFLLFISIDILVSNGKKRYMLSFLIAVLLISIFYFFLSNASVISEYEVSKSINNNGEKKYIKFALTSWDFFLLESQSEELINCSENKNYSYIRFESTYCFGKFKDVKILSLGDYSLPHKLSWKHKDFELEDINKSPWIND